MKIRSGLHLVGSGRSGFDLTEAFDCNIFMVGTEAGYVLFDSGAGRDPDGILEEIKRDGIDPSDVTTLFLTHGHVDHSGGVEPLRQRLPQLTVAAGPKTAAILKTGDERLISLDRARGRFYPQDYLWTAPMVDRVLTPDQPGRVGDLSVTLVETPGHSDDHVSYLLRQGDWTALIGGDALFAGGKVILQDIPDCDVAATIATVRKLATLSFDAFLPGHGAFSLVAGTRHVEAALVYADRGLPPPSFF